jgi:hypothetical protein
VGGTKQQSTKRCSRKCGNDGSGRGGSDSDNGFDIGSGNNDCSDNTNGNGNVDGNSGDGDSSNDNCIESLMLSVGVVLRVSYSQRVALRGIILSALFLKPYPLQKTKRTGFHLGLDSESFPPPPGMSLRAMVLLYPTYDSSPGPKT